MNVLLVSKTYPLQAACDGTGAIAALVAEGLVARGHVVEVLTAGRAGDAVRNGVAIRAGLIMDQPEPYKPPARWTAWDRLLWIHKSRHNYHAVRREVARFQPDVVYLNDIELLTGAVFNACVAADVPRLWHAHDYTLRDLVLRAREAPAVTARRRHLQRFAHVAQLEEALTAPVIAVSAFVAEAYRAVGWREDVVTVVPNGLPEWFFASGPREAPPAADWRLLFVGRCVPDKGLAQLIEVLRLLRERGLALPLLVVGSFPDEAARGAFLASAGLAGVREQIEARDAVPREQLPALYRQAACLLAPSQWSEPFGLMSAEAQACGTPVIASRVGGLPDTLQDGVTGFLCEAGDAAAMAARVAQLQADAALWQRMSAAAREFAAGAFRPERVLEQIEAIITRVARPA
jgi:glycosyltransferase involved in cell wall biosynthesis